MKLPLTMCLEQDLFSHAGRGLGQLETGPSYTAGAAGGGVPAGDDADGGCEGPSGPGPGLLPLRPDEPLRRALLGGSAFYQPSRSLTVRETYMPDSRFDIVLGVMLMR